MKTHLALLSALVPCAAFVSGCGGGGGNGPTAIPTPAPTFIGPSTGPGSFPAVIAPETVLVLPGGELGILNLKGTAGSAGATGTLRVLSGVSSTTSLPVGTYQLSGVFSPPFAFSVESQNTSTGKFSLSGSVANDINPRGIYTLSRGRDRAAAQGITNDDFTRASTPYRPSAEITFSPLTATTTNIGGGQTQTSTFIAPITRDGAGSFNPANSTSVGAFYRQVATEPTNLAFNVTGTRPTTDAARYVNLTIKSDYIRPFTVGTVIDLSNPRADASQNNAVIVQFGQASAQYVSTRGKVTVRDFGAETLSLELRDVTAVINSRDDATGATTVNAITLNGTFDASGMLNTLQLNPLFFARRKSGKDSEQKVPNPPSSP